MDEPKEPEFEEFVFEGATVKCRDASLTLNVAPTGRGDKDTELAGQEFLKIVRKFRPSSRARLLLRYRVQELFGIWAHGGATDAAPDAAAPKK